MKCKNCGRDIDESMKFCPECGEILDSEIYNKEKIENASDMPKEENVNNSDSSEEKIESTLESQEETVDKNIQKVRDEVARGAIKYVTTAEMGALSGNLYLTNYKNLYFISNGKRETYLLESKTESITRTGRRIIVEMKDGEEYTFDTQRSFDARSLVKKTKWSLQDDGVVYDDEVYASEDDSEYYEEDSKSHGKIAAIFIVLVIVGALCFQFGPKLFKSINKSDDDTEITKEVKKVDWVANSPAEAERLAEKFINWGGKNLVLRTRCTNRPGGGYVVVAVLIDGTIEYVKFDSEGMLSGVDDEFSY